MTSVHKVKCGETEIKKKKKARQRYGKEVVCSLSL
jgi:hypothetical protein